MLDVLITGSGMVATALAEAAPRFGLSFEMHPQIRTDVTDEMAVRSAVQSAQPRIIFHTAALTRVNYCQEHPDEAMLVNSDGTANVVRAAREADAQVIYFSTDYVFNGRVGRPWIESDSPAPLNAYGESKLAGEDVVRGYSRGCIVRTSGVFGSSSDPAGERNFFRAVATRLRQDSGEIPVVADQVTAVTCAPHLAEMIFTLLKNGLPPIVHLTSDGNGSWYDWARLTVRLLGEDKERIFPTGAAAFGDPTPRPTMGVLGSELDGITRLKAKYPATDGLAAYLDGLGQQPSTSP